MPIQIDWINELILITSPDTSVDLQSLHDYIEDERGMASPVGLIRSAILQPEGKIEDPTNPGVYSQIILVMQSPWQIQFWGGSGYTRVYGGKIVGGLNDQPIKATGTAGDITVLESPVDGVYTAGSTSQIASAVWDESTSGHTSSGTFGEQLKTKVDAVLADTNELQSDDVPGLISGLNDLSAAEVNAEVVGVLRTDLLPDDYAADGDQPTIAQAILAMHQYLMERAVSGTTVTVKKPDGSTTAMTFTLDDPASPTSITRAS